MRIIGFVFVRVINKRRHINTFIASLLNYFIIIYLNNILIYSKNPEEYKEHIRQVIAKLCKYKLYAKLSKYEFSV
jgi:hypothetical protein